MGSRPPVPGYNGAMRPTRRRGAVGVVLLAVGLHGAAAGAIAAGSAALPAASEVTAIAPAAPTTAARGPAGDWLRVTGDTIEYEFSERMSFELAVTADARVTGVVLRYTIGEGLPVNRRIPRFKPDERLVARHDEQLARGAMPPAAEIRWWWEITDLGGRTALTEARTERYLDQRHQWSSATHGDVRVWWYGDQAAAADRVGETAASDIERLERLLGASSGEPVEVVIYANQADLRPAMADRGETYEASLATLGARVGPNTLVLDVGTGDAELEEILAHELSHLVLHRRFAHEYVDAPAWLDEGLAMYVEGDLESGEARVLERALRDDAIMSLRSLSSFPGQADLVPLAYAQSRDIVEYLLESHGVEHLRRLVAAIGSGDLTADEAVATVYGMDQLGLYQAYRSARGLDPAATPSAPRTRSVGTGPVYPTCAPALALPVLSLAWLVREDRRRPPRSSRSGDRGVTAAPDVECRGRDDIGAP